MASCKYGDQAQNKATFASGLRTTAGKVPVGGLLTTPVKEVTVLTITKQSHTRHPSSSSRVDLNRLASFGSLTGVICDVHRCENVLRSII